MERVAQSRMPNKKALEIRGAKVAEYIHFDKVKGREKL